MAPLVSLLLCTVRPSHAYKDHPEWDVIGKVVQDLCTQADAPPFELVIVDGLYTRGREDLSPMLHETLGDIELPFAIRHLPPRKHSPWVHRRKVAISAYRNTGISVARGELIVNLDDCCVLPPDFVATFWRAWKVHNVALAMTWPNRSDHRRPGPVELPGSIYGFGSYPRELAFELNGYDEAYDGGQGLEDADWSVRLFLSGLKQALIRLPGFDIEPQTAHSPMAIDSKRPIVKCCNAAWQEVRVRNNVRVANQKETWSDEALSRLVGPCIHLHGEMCGHHGNTTRCAYLEAGFATALDPEASIVLEEPPVLDLEQLAEELA